MIQTNSDTILINTNPIKLLKSLAILSLLVSVLLGGGVFVVKVISQPLDTRLSENTGEQNITDISPPLSKPTLSAYALPSTSITTSQTCRTYHLYNQIKNVGEDGNQNIATLTSPSTVSATEKIEETLPLLSDTNVEIARFYSDPVLTTDFALVEDIVGMLWLQTSDFDNTNFTITVLDYNPANGNTTLLGNLEFKLITDGQNEANLIVTSSAITIPVGHRFLFILYGRSPILTQPTVTLYYNSLNRNSRFSLCQITPPILNISKNAPQTVIAGSPITYTLTISNSGGLKATHLIISDTIPANATYITGGTQAVNVVTWSVASLAAKSAIQTAFVVTATETITNSDYQVVADDNIFAVGQNDVVTLVSPPGQPNLSISKHGPVEVDTGDFITYTLTVLNSGDTTATNLLISDTIPAGATYISGGEKTGNIASWSAISLAAKTSLDFRLIVTATNTITNEDYRVTADQDQTAIGNESVATKIIAKPSAIYLPVILRAMPQTTLIIQSENTGGIDPIQILDPDNNNNEVLSCTIGNDVTELCGTFPAIGNYTIVAYTVNCGVLQGTFNDATAGATITRRIYCN